MLSNFPLVTIIIPIYNAEKFVDKCLKSVIAQSYQNIEIILINDGSEDYSKQKCDSWAKKDRRISVIHKKNAGVSSARNTGIDIAKGQYIYFVDSDDWLPNDSIEEMIRYIVSSNADFCCGSIERVGVFSKTSQTVKTILEFHSDDLEKMLRFLEYIESCPSPWGKMYRTDIIRTNSIKFVEGIAYGEDSIFLWTYLEKCHKIVAIPNIVYCYSVLNSGNASGKFYPELVDWIKISVDRFSSIFIDKENCEVQTEILKYAVKMIDHVIYKYSNAPIQTEEAIEFIEKTINVFGVYFIEVERNTPPTMDVFMQKYSYIFDNSDLSYIYKLSKQRSSLIDKTIKRIRGWLNKVAVFFVYRVNLLYHI